MAISPGKPLISDFIGLTLRNGCLGSVHVWWPDWQGNRNLDAATKAAWEFISETAYIVNVFVQFNLLWGYILVLNKKNFFFPEFIAELLVLFQKLWLGYIGPMAGYRLHCCRFFLKRTGRPQSLKGKKLHGVVRVSTRLVRCFLSHFFPQPFQHHGVYVVWFWGTFFRFARLQMGFGQCSPRQDVWRKDGYLEASAHLLGVRAQAGRHERPQGYRESVDSKEVFCLAARHAARESRVCDVFQGRSSVSGGLHDSAWSPRLGTGMPECCWHLWNVGSFCKASGRIVWAASRHVLDRETYWCAEAVGLLKATLAEWTTRRENIAGLPTGNRPTAWCYGVSAKCPQLSAAKNQCPRHPCPRMIQLIEV